MLSGKSKRLWKGWKGLLYTADVNVLGSNINTIKNSVDIILQVGKETGLEVTIDKNK
jgi:hypothetical protein